MRCILGRLHLFVLGFVLIGLLANTAVAGIAYGDPAGGWTYTYGGEDADAGGPFESLDGTWDHDNGSDQWDGSGIGAGNPGGVSALSDPDGTFYLRMVDTGDPRDQGIAEPSNRKYFFAHDIGAEGASDTQMDEGITLSFRARIPVDGPLAGVDPGNGYVNHDGGKSTFTVSQAGDGGKTISFFLAGEEEDQTNFLGPGLGMNSLDEAAGGSPSGAVDWQGSEGTPNLFALDDPTEWHEFWINIFAPGGTPGSHLAVVYADGGTTPAVFDVTAGTGRDYDVNYITMGLGSTPQQGAVDIDFISWAPGILEPVVSMPELPCDFNADELCDVADIDLLGKEILAGTNDPAFDLTGDNVVDIADQDRWRADAATENGWAEPYLPGDADLDGSVLVSDLNIVGTNWQQSPDPWGSGDFNVDGVVDVMDLNALALNWQESIPTAAAAAVPEPSTILLLVFGLAGMLLRRHR